MFQEWNINCSPPGSSVHVILQARILEWLDISYCRGYSWPWSWIPISCVSCIGRKIFLPLSNKGSPSEAIVYIELEHPSVQFSHSVMSNSLRPHEPQHTRLPCPSATPRVYPNSCPLNRWCYLTISSSVIPFSSCLRSFPASGSFQMSQLFASGGQNIGVSASTSIYLAVSNSLQPHGL